MPPEEGDCAPGPDASRAIMLGVRHRCGQEVQFWIPAVLVATIAHRLDEQTETLGLAEWMRDEGILKDCDEPSPEVLVERLRDEMSPRGIAFIHVDQDISACPSCGGMMRWLDILVDAARAGRDATGQ